MYDPEDDIRYEIEIMLGTLDETHIIRTIEYWDIERQRFPTHEHRAVIVAEEVTSRFFNVIRLLNQAIPMIALQLNAFRLGDAIVLHFTKVLDVYESVEEAEESGGEQADRRYWEKRANPASLQVADRIISMVPSQNGTPRVTYNRGHIAVGTAGYNFCWLHPRKSAHCHMQMKPGNENRDEMIRKLEEAGIPAAPHRRNSIKFKVTQKDLDASAAALRDALERCERLSREGPPSRGAMRPNARSLGFALARQHGIGLFSLLRSLKGGKRRLGPVEIDSVLTHRTLPLVVPGF